MLNFILSSKYCQEFYRRIYSIFTFLKNGIATNREITEKNVNKIIYCAKLRDYIENQGFKEQKVTSGIDLEHVYSKQ